MLTKHLASPCIHGWFRGTTLIVEYKNSKSIELDKEYELHRIMSNFRHLANSFEYLERLQPVCPSDLIKVYPYIKV